MHKAFVEAVKNKSFAKDSTREAKSAYKKAAVAAFEDTLNKSPVILTTLSKTADTALMNAIAPTLILIEESTQGKELETYLLRVHHIQSVRQSVYVGDDKQLRPTVKTYSLNSAENLVNPFADQMLLTNFARLVRRGHHVYMLNEQFRLVAGLEEVFNRLFYKNVIVNAPTTKNREATKKAAKFTGKFSGSDNGVPHLCLHVQNGVCIRSEQQSRFNPHNIAATLHYVRAIIKDKLHPQEHITIITPYRAQATRYRQALVWCRGRSNDNHRC